MNSTILELIEKNKKNSRLNLADKESFEKELYSELSAGVYTEEIETYLCEGPVELTMKVLATFLSSIEQSDAANFYKKFSYSERITENKGGTSGIRMVYLLAEVIKCKRRQDNLVEKVFLSLVRFGYKNEKKEANRKRETNKKVLELINTIIFPLCNEIDFWMNLHFVGADKTWVKVRDLFGEAMIKNDKNSFDIIQKAYYWLKSAGKDMGKYTEEYLRASILKKVEKKEEEKKEITEIVMVGGINKATDDDVSVPKKNVKQDKQIVSNKSKEQNGREFLEIINGLATLAVTEHKKIEVIENELLQLRYKFDELQVQLNKTLNREQEQEERIRILASEKSNLGCDNAALQKHIVELEQLVDKLNREIDDRKQFTDTVARNREKQSEEYLNRLASKLKVDYRDYCDAKQLEMTVDLGENMREQLGAVFSILEKNGIKLS